MKWCNKFGRRYWLSRIFLASVGTLIMMTSSTAQAQLTPWDHNNQVMVDLSILDEIRSLRGPAPYVGVSTLPKPRAFGTRLLDRTNSGSELLDPPKRTPVSKFLIKRAPKLRPLRRAKNSGLKLLSPRNNTKRSTISKRQTAAIKQKSPSARQTSNKKSSVSKNTARTKSKVKSQSKPKTSNSLDVDKKQKTVKIGELPPPPTIVAAPPPTKKLSKLSSKPSGGKQKQIEPATSKPKEQQQAALPQDIPTPTSVNVVFSPGGSKLSISAKKALDLIATDLNSNKDIRMQLMAYAGEAQMAASKARRLSLSRALAVRSYLIEKGIRGTRIDVRALGNKVSSGLPNRVDLRVIRQ